MSHYIDADAIEDKAKQYSLGYYEEDEWAVPFKEINSAPSIVIVRCGECKWHDDGQNESDSWSYCTRHFEHYIDVNADDFCSYGERKDEPQTERSIGCSRCESRHWCYDRDKPNANHCNNYGKITDKLQTERSE